MTQPGTERSQSQDTQQRIRDLVAADRVVLFMKGSRVQPQCGFSAQLVQILDRLLPEYTTYDVLSDPELREGVKHFAEWPTIPQLYVEGEFQGGCDIVRELYQSGELHRLLGVERPAPADVHLAVSPEARQILVEAQSRHGGELHLAIDARYRPQLGFGPAAGDEVVVDLGEGLRVLLDRESASRADGVSIEVVSGPHGPSLRIDNPSSPRVPSS